MRIYLQVWGILSFLMFLACYLSPLFFSAVGGFILWDFGVVTRFIHFALTDTLYLRTVAAFSVLFTGLVMWLPD